MNEYRLSGNNCGDRILAGETLPAAVEADMSAQGSRIVDMTIGAVIGYDLISVDMAYDAGILGGKGGCIVTIAYKLHHALNVRPSGDDPTRIRQAWIYCTPADLPEPVRLAIRANAGE
jgi:hypothetical protein